MIGELVDVLAASDYQIARTILQRGLAVAYLVAFLNVRNQFRPLLGQKGLLPVPDYLATTTFWAAPSLFHWLYSDRLVGIVSWTGMALSAGILVGGIDVLPLGAGVACWLVMWALYLSIVNVGQTFYGFGWESLLLEAGFYAAFLGNAQSAPPWLVLLAFRWLLFRVEFGAGMIKMRGDPCWRDLTCLHYHHETQPMPGPTSRWFHHLPSRLHKVEVAANHFSQLVVPFAFFLPQPAAGVGALVVLATQGYLSISGNYAWLNFVTLILAFSAIPDSWYGILGAETSAMPPAPAWFLLLPGAVAALVVWMSRHPVRNLLGRRQLMNYSFNRLHLVNTYGAFGSVTRHRRELVIEGTFHPDDEQWHAYEFKGKPTDPMRRPSQWAPYHLRLDWLMWFVPLSPVYGRGWLDRLIEGLLEADVALLSLLRRDPFDGRPPARIRGRLVDYRFSTRREKDETGAWWITGTSRTLFGPLESRTGGEPR